MFNHYSTVAFAGVLYGLMCSGNILANWAGRCNDEIDPSQAWLMLAPVQVQQRFGVQISIDLLVQHIFGQFLADKHCVNGKNMMFVIPLPR